ncbi:hypothetical protein ACFFU8_01645 [Chromobacterium piscinae]|uniref:hypothetical protein n=1 Tax=Chromobacterium piscinae TaxID=686831 RepID=UPI001E36A780|nr:hypothetical protein [Chromobacterium piscinae]MCD5329980.1 hypothetical protein [Chromobacterium piscinae]
MATLSKGRARLARRIWQGIMPTTFKMTRKMSGDSVRIHPSKNRKMDEFVHQEGKQIGTSAMNTILYKLARLLL